MGAFFSFLFCFNIVMFSVLKMVSFINLKEDQHFIYQITYVYNLEIQYTFLYILTVMPVS